MPFLALLGNYKVLWEFMGALVLVAAFSFGIHQFLEHERDIGRNEVRAEYQAKLLEATQAAKAKEEADAKRLQEAQDALAQSQETIRSLSAANAAVSSGLRDTANTISKRIPSLTADALRNITEAYGRVFTDCQTKYGSLAEDAERLNAEKRALIQAWPK